MDGNAHKLLPQNLEAEQSVLGAILLDNKVIPEVKEIIVADDFYRDAHRKIFSAIVELDEKNEAIDLITLTNELRSKNQLDAIGGASYVASLLDTTPTAENVGEYAKIVKEKAILRKIIEVATDVITMSYQDDKEVDDVVGAFQLACQEIVEKSATGKKIERITIADVQKLISLRETPHEKLNQVIGGFLGKELIAVGGNKGMGKTSFVSGLLTYTAMVEKRPAIYCGAAMSKERFKLRLLSKESRIPFDSLIRGKISREESVRALAAQKALDEAPIYYMIEPKELNIILVAAEIKKLKRKIGNLGLGIVVIENFQELRFPGKFKDKFEEQIRVATTLTGLTDELDTPIVVSCQIGKETDKRENRRPMLSDLKDAGAIGEKAIKVFLLYRPAFYNLETSVSSIEQQAKPEVGEVIIAKGGPSIIVPHYFDGRIYSWWDID